MMWNKRAGKSPLSLWTSVPWTYGRGIFSGRSSLESCRSDAQVENPIKEGGLDEAERTCKELMTRYPDQIDGIERLAAVYEARIMGL